MTTYSELQHGCRQTAWLARMARNGGRYCGYGLVALAYLYFANGAASGAPTTYNVSFSANSFQVGSGASPAPVDPVVGSVTVTLDPSVAVFNQTTGITLNSLNIALGSSISFSYDPAAGGFPAGTLRVGGINAGTDTIIFSPSTNDFWLFINDLTGSPAFQQMGYTQTAVSSNNLFYTINQTGSVGVSVVPEPASVALIVVGAALAGFGVAARRNARSV